jgi:hypothetical protein
MVVRLAISSSVITSSIDRRHPAISPLLVPQTVNERIREHPTSSMTASFMESIV